MSSTQLENAGVNPTRPWPADQQERWPIERLTLYANNARLHSETDLDKLAASILKFGWTMPPLVDEQGALIVGQGRVEAAATRLGIKEVPVLVARLERGGEACLSSGRQSTGGAGELGLRAPQ
jgi:hypothetical protein